MATTAYTDRILPGEAIYLAPNGRFHRPGCRYYVAPGPDATFVEGTFTPAFLSNYCKVCFPAGVPAVEQEPEIEPEPENKPEPTPSPLPAEPRGSSERGGTGDLRGSGELRGTGSLRGEERHRKRRKKQKFVVRPPAVTKVQVAIFLVVVGGGVGLFVALAAFLNWFG